MSALNDFSRRFFADFIASRIRIWSQQVGGPPSSIRPAAGPNGLADSAGPEPDAEAETGRDGRGLRVPDPSGRQPSPDQGIE
jgi:hypothetical protein